MNLYNELVNKINELKEKNKKIVTNSFYSMQQLKFLLDMNNVTIKISEDLIIMLIEEDRLIRLYFYTTSLEVLKLIKNMLPRHMDKPIIVDIIGKDLQLEKVINKFQELNFYKHNKLIRMNRKGQEYPKKDISNVIFATEDMACKIMDILYNEFDIYISRLPTKEKVLNSIESKEITVVMQQEKIVGLAYFEKLGEKLNYLYQIVVDKNFRGQGISDSLLMNKFKYSPKDVACQLWVEINNKYAIDKYHEYNFKPDGLVDYIMIYEGE